jgi:uncharacterized membrane protein YphA (DoxX/SURF4 family)
MVMDGMAARLPRALGSHLRGLGVMALGVVGLALGDFIPGQPAPAWLPLRPALALAVAVFMLAAGAGVQWRRTAAWAAGALTAYYAVFVVLLMDGRSILRHARELLAYTNTAEQVAIAAAGLIVFAATAPIDPALASRLARIGRLAFGVCAILFGVAHFAFMNLTAPLVPSWLPPSQTFWGYATGVAHIAGGVAILTGVQARLAALLLTVMYAAFTPLVHLPLLFAHPLSHQVWAENATNLVLAGAAWVVADSLAWPVGSIQTAPSP